MARFALTLLVAIFSIYSSHAEDRVPAASSKHSARMGGWEAFAELQNGNMRFHEGRARHPNQDPGTRQSVAGGQKPHTIILSCSDSRLPPEEIFDQGLGDVFTVRLAGNLVTPEAIASIEYAIEHLGSRLLLVMGHESCGAVGAAVGSKAGKSAGSENLDSLVAQIRRHLTVSSIALSGSDKTMRQAVKENVSGNMRELLRRSEIVRNAVANDGLVFGQAIYSLSSGKVEFWDMSNRLESLGMNVSPPVREQVVKEEIVTDSVVPGGAPPKAKH